MQFQPVSNSRPLSLSGNGSAGISTTIYVPAANAGLSGNGQTWDVVGNQNWSSAATIGNPNEFYQGDNVTFSDSNNATVNGGTNPNAYNVILNTIANPVLMTGPGFVTKDNALRVINLSQQGTR